MFTKDEIPPLINKITEMIERETLTSNKMTVNDFTDIAVKLRVSREDVNSLIQYLQSIGFIERRGKIIYRLSNVNHEESKPSPGRPRKLSDEEIQWIKDNYEFGKFGSRKMAKIINEKRNEEISYRTVARVI